MGHHHFLHRNPLTGEHGAVHRFFAKYIAHKAIVAADADRGIRRLPIRNLQRGALDVQLLNAHVMERRFRSDFCDRRARRIEIHGVVGIRQRNIERQLFSVDRRDFAFRDSAARLADPGLRFTIALQIVHLHELHPRGRRWPAD